MFHRSAKIPADASKEHIINYVNQHTEPIHAWRSTKATVNVTGVVIPLQAMLAVEQPNHFRLTVSSGLTGNELDLGSNPDHVWFWVQRMDPQTVMTCRHEEIEAVQDQLQVPFQPDWLMEVLCVKPIDGSEAELIRDPQDPYEVKLVSHHTNESGFVTRRIVTIDLRRGVIVSHQLYDAHHRLIAKADLSDYRDFPHTNARLPHDIQLCWVEQDLKLRISLNGVEVNPPHLSAEIWTAPNPKDCRVVELKRDQLVHPAAGLVRSEQEKPKAITHYELDAPSGVWLQDQKIRIPKDAPATPVEPHASSTKLANAELSTPAGNPYYQPGDLPGSPHNPLEPPPFPDQSARPGHARVQTASNLPADGFAPPRKSRETLIDGIPASEFEPPVRR